MVRVDGLVNTPNITFASKKFQIYAGFFGI